MIVPMKKAQIVVLKEDKNELLKSLQRYGVFMIIKKEDHTDFDPRIESALSQRTEKSLKLMKNYTEKKGLIRDLVEVTYDDFVSEDKKRLEMLERIEAYDQKINALKHQVESIYQDLKALSPWHDLDFSYVDTKKLRYATIYTMFVEKQNVEQIVGILTEFDLPFKLLGFDSDFGQALVFATLKSEQEEVFNKLSLIGYNEVKIDKDERLVKDIIVEKEELIKKNNEEIAVLQESLKIEASKVQELQVLSDQIATLNELKKVKGDETHATFYLEGWVRSDRLDHLEKAIKEVTDVYDLATFDPTEGEIPPTVTKNNKLITPFETITDMFSRPGQGDIDPNPLMSFWYWIIFGIMMGDAGYGLVMILLFSILIKIMRPKGEGLKLYKMLLYCGITTIFWGVLFGSYFGFTWNPILFGDEMMKKPLEILIFSLILGALHIISGLLASAYKNFKHGKYSDIIFDQVSWIFIIIGLGLLFLPAVSSIGIVLALIGVAIILLTAGRGNKNIFGRIGKGFSSLYGVTGYMSDILSYSRLLALGLSTSVVSYVMNLLAGMLQSNIIGAFFSIFVYLFGHSFNIVMGLLSAYVHDSRLQYIEFFGKFYEGGGYAFEPLSLRLKYVDKIIDK